jgi:hypothetical protein
MPGRISWPVMPLCLTQCHSLIPARSATMRRHRGKLRRRQGRRHAAPPAAARALLRGASAFCLGIVLTLAAPWTCSAQVASPAQTSLDSERAPAHAYAAFIAAASHRFAIPERWISAVIQIESGWNSNAISRRGAFGLMQIRPQTWVELSVRYDLGIDPLDPKDNITAGTAYLREMLDRFGSKGIFAAYNAGPARYSEHLATGRPLPDETQAYVARLAPLVAGEPREPGTSIVRDSVAWQQASVFVRRSVDPPADRARAPLEGFVSSSKTSPQQNAFVSGPRAGALFVQRPAEVNPR